VPDSPPQWYLAEPEEGPYRAAELAEMAADGRLDPGRPVFKAGMREAVPAGRIAGLFPESAAGVEEGESTGRVSTNLFATPGGEVARREHGADAPAAFAGYLVRTVAFTIDALLVLGVFAAVILAEILREGPYLNQDDWFKYAIGFLVLPAVFYFPVCEGISGTTLGKRLFGIRVVDAEGARIGPGRAFLRQCLRLMFFALPFLPLVDHLLAIFHPARRTLHDLLAGTWCILPSAGGRRVREDENLVAGGFLALDDRPFDPDAYALFRERREADRRRRLLGWIWFAHGGILIATAGMIYLLWLGVGLIDAFIRQAPYRGLDSAELEERLAYLRALLELGMYSLPALLSLGAVITAVAIASLRRAAWSWYALIWLSWLHLIGLIPIAVALLVVLSRIENPVIGESRLERLMMVIGYVLNVGLVIATQGLLIWMHSILRSPAIRARFGGNREEGYSR